MKEIEFYTLDNGKIPVQIWLESLDTINRARVYARFARIQNGNLGDYKKINNEIAELRFNFSKGYRIYFAEINNVIILLLNAGDKKTQSSDIKKHILISKIGGKNKMTKYKNSTSLQTIMEQYLKSPEDIKEYLNGALELYIEEGDFNAFYNSLEYVIKAQGNLSEFARKTGISRANLYNIYQSKKEPKIQTVAKILKELGFSLKVA